MMKAAGLFEMMSGAMEVVITRGNIYETQQHLVKFTRRVAKLAAVIVEDVGVGLVALLVGKVPPVYGLEKVLSLDERVRSREVGVCVARCSECAQLAVLPIGIDPLLPDNGL